MPKPAVSYAELGGCKLKRGKGFLKPNFGVGPNQKIFPNNSSTLVLCGQHSVVSQRGVTSQKITEGAPREENKSLSRLFTLCTRQL